MDVKTLNLAMIALVKTIETTAEFLFPENQMGWSINRKEFVENFIKNYTENLKNEDN